MQGGRGGLGVAALILLALGLLCVALAAALLGDAGETLPRGWAMLRGLPGPSAAAANAARHAIEGAAPVTVICLALALPLGWALGRLPPGWAALARALLCYPALTLLIAWALGLAVLLQGSDPAAAILSAGASLGLPAGPRAWLVVLLTPPLAGVLGAGWQRLDVVALRAAETLGIGPTRIFFRLVLPELAGPLLDGAALVFLASAAVLAARPESPPVPLDTAAIGALAAVAAAVIMTLWLLWRALVQRPAS